MRSKMDPEAANKDRESAAADEVDASEDVGLNTTAAICEAHMAQLREWTDRWRKHYDLEGAEHNAEVSLIRAFLSSQDRPWDLMYYNGENEQDEKTKRRALAARDILIYQTVH